MSKPAGRPYADAGVRLAAHPLMSGASMPTERNRTDFPTAIRLTEVENAVLNVLDDRGVRSGQTIFVGEVDIAMDARGYSGRWVVQAVESLVKKGLLQRCGSSTVARTDHAKTIRNARARASYRRARRAVPI